MREKTLYLSLEDVAETTGLPFLFWLFMAENENVFDVERFEISLGGEPHINLYYLIGYLLDPHLMYYLDEYQEYISGDNVGIEKYTLTGVRERNNQKKSVIDYSDKVSA